jgi:hypothetical protein
MGPSDSVRLYDVGLSANDASLSVGHKHAAAGLAHRLCSGTTRNMQRRLVQLG